MCTCFYFNPYAPFLSKNPHNMMLFNTQWHFLLSYFHTPYLVMLRSWVQFIVLTNFDVWKVLPMIVRRMTNSKTTHLKNQTAALRKQFVPESIKRLVGSSFFSASVIRCPFRCPGILSIVFGFYRFRKYILKMIKCCRLCSPIPNVSFEMYKKSGIL